MSCESCRDMQEVDGAIPDCEAEGKSCLIPPLSDEGRRVMEIHSILRSLGDLVDAGTILQMYEAQKEDIEYLAIVESEIRKNSKPGKMEN